MFDIPSLLSLFSGRSRFFFSDIVIISSLSHSLAVSLFNEMFWYFFNISAQNVGPLSQNCFLYIPTISLFNFYGYCLFDSFPRSLCIIHFAPPALIFFTILYFYLSLRLNISAVSGNSDLFFLICFMIIRRSISF